VPTYQNRRTCNEEALQLFFNSGCYPEFWGIQIPQYRLDPHTNNPLDYFLLLCPESLSDVIVAETKKYSRGKAKLVDVDREKLLNLFELVIMMGIKRLPRIENF